MSDTFTRTVSVLSLMWAFTLATAPVSAQEPEVIGPGSTTTTTVTSTTQPATTTPETQPGWGTQPTTTQPGWGTPPPTGGGWGTPPPPPVEAPKGEGLNIVNSTYGSINLALALQARLRFDHITRADYFGYLWDAVTTDDNSEMHFEVQRARLALLGHLINPKLKYYAEVDLFGGVEGLNPVPYPLWQQAKIGYQIGDTDKFRSTIWLGYMRVPFGLLAERPIHRLGAIEYPLYMMEGSGHFPLCPWSQSGLMWDAKFVDKIRLVFGVFNGHSAAAAMDLNGDGITDTYGSTFGLWSDLNMAKDFFLKFAFVSEKIGLDVGLNIWLGFPPTQNATTADADKSDTAFTMGLEVGWEAKGFNIMSEFLVGILRLNKGQHPQPDPVTGFPHSDYTENLATSLSFMLHFGYTIKDIVELMLRLDVFDPIINEQDGTAYSFGAFPTGPGRDTVNDIRMRITTGPQIKLEKLHSMISLNYALDMLHHNNRHILPPDPRNPEATSINVFNHIVMVQASIALW